MVTPMPADRQFTEALGSLDDARRATGRLHSRLTQRPGQSERARMALKVHMLLLEAEQLLHDDAQEKEE
jgi:hypothetical protein